MDTSICLFAIILGAMGLLTYNMSSQSESEDNQGDVDDQEALDARDESSDCGAINSNNKRPNQAPKSKKEFLEPHPDTTTN